MRRKHRLTYALMHLGHVRKKSLENPSLSDGFALGAADRYVDEVISSHPKHRMPSSAEAEDALSTRLSYALKHLEFVRKKSLEDPALSKGNVLAAAQRYVDELRSSHPEHRMPSCPETEGAGSTDRGDNQHGSGDQSKEQRERQSSADPEAKSTADSDKTRGEKPSTPEKSPACSKSAGTDAPPDTDTEKALKTAFLNQLDVMDKMTDLEDKVGIIAPGGYKNMNALTRLAGAILKEELKRRK